MRNIQVNGFGELVVPVPKAVCDRTGKAAFFLDNDYNLGQSNLFFRIGKAGRISVNCIRLDEFLDEAVAVDLIKMDMEGAELHALMGMENLTSRAKRSLTVFIECNAHSSVLRDILQASLLTG